MLRLRSLGPPRLVGVPDGALSTRRKQAALLAYLRTRPRGTASRGSLISLLWEDRDEARARQSLRQALLELRRAVGPGLLVTDDSVQLQDQAFHDDSAEFEKAVAECRWVEAIDLWEGDYMDGAEDMAGETFRAWLEAERERLRALASRAFREAVGAAAAKGDWPGAALLAGRWVSVLPSDLAGHPRLVEALALAGRTAEACARCAELITRARNELGLEPAPELLAWADRLARTPAAAPAASRPGSAAVFSPDLVGREGSMAELAAIWSSLGPSAQVGVTIEGEPGVGKTRLADEFLRRLASGLRPPLVLRAMGRRPGALQPLDGLRQLLEQVHGSAGVAGASPESLATLAEYAPGLRRYGAAATLGQRRLDEALIDLLDALGEDRPLLLLLDDLGALDRDTLSVVALVQPALRARTLVLSTARSGEAAAPGHPAGAIRLHLHPLTPHDLELMLGSMLAIPTADRQRLARRLHAATAGNPRHSVELVAALVEEGLLAPAEDGSWRAPDAEGWPLPSDLRRAVALRLERLEAEPRAVLDAAAVLRADLTPALLASMSDLPEPHVAAALDELIGRRLLSTPTQGSLEFPHEFTARVAYEALAPEQRIRLHGRAASALATSRVDPSGRGLVAYHRARAQPLSRMRSRRLAALLVAAVLVVAVAAGGYRRLAPARAPVRVLVAPFENRTGDSSLSAIGDMAADWVTQNLAQTGLVPIVDLRSARAAESAVETTGGTPPRADQRIGALARETGAGLVVWGAYYRSGDTLVVQGRISDPAKGEVVRVIDPIRVPLARPLEAIEQLSARTTGAFALLYNRWGSGWIESARRPPTLEAYRRFLAGLDLHVQYRYPEALEQYRQALAADSTYVEPLLWSALAYWSLREYPKVDSVLRLAERSPQSLGRFDEALLRNARGELQADYVAARDAAGEMARIAPGSEAWVIVGQEELKLHRPSHALAAFRRADPERGWLRGWEGYWGYVAGSLHFLGRHGEALEAARETRRRFPRSVYQIEYETREFAALGEVDSVRGRLEESLTLPPGLWARGYVYLDATQELAAHGHAQAARRILDDGLRITAADTSDTPAALDLRANLLLTAGDWDELSALARRQAPRDRENPAWLGYLGVAAARTKAFHTADSLSAMLAHGSFPYSYGLPDLWRARISAAHGDPAQAVARLQDAIDHGLVFDDRLHLDPSLAVLRGYPPFDELMKSRD